MSPKTKSVLPADDQQMSTLWLYDELMKNIEPDLVSDQINDLDKKYAGETEDERENRLAHYEMAFQIFEECLEELDLTMQLDMEMLKHEMIMLSVEDEDNSQTSA